MAGTKDNSAVFVIYWHNGNIMSQVIDKASTILKNTRFFLAF